MGIPRWAFSRNAQTKRKSLNTPPYAAPKPIKTASQQNVLSSAVAVPVYSLYARVTKQAQMGLRGVRESGCGSSGHLTREATFETTCSAKRSRTANKDFFCAQHCRASQRVQAVACMQTGSAQNEKRTYFLWSVAAGPFASPRSLKVMMQAAWSDHWVEEDYTPPHKQTLARSYQIAPARSRYTLLSVLRNQIRSLAYILQSTWLAWAL